ncbi:MAG: hypothetical protein EOO28_17785 [Comamonadaceae bacterium]|nr:MAG: hypothetical protein EOO28_17785 [Comamonadaceae bacterium]
MRLDQLERELVTGGLQAGLAWLNCRVPHRFTAAYLLGGEMLHLVALADKSGVPTMREQFDSVRLADSFCMFTLRDGRFVTSETRQDKRLNEHPAQSRLRSYVGLPVHHAPGEPIGTFCHFDFAPQTLEDAEFAFLEDAVTFLSPYVERVLKGSRQRMGEVSRLHERFRTPHR